MDPARQPAVDISKHARAPARDEQLATIEHLLYQATPNNGGSGWTCKTIVDGEAMSRKDALFIARTYAKENNIPVIYECHSDPED